MVFLSISEEGLRFITIIVVISGSFAVQLFNRNCSLIALEILISKVMVTEFRRVTTSCTRV